MKFGGHIASFKIRVLKVQDFGNFELSSMLMYLKQNYLQGLFLEKTKSELHTIFQTGTVKEKAKIKHQGFGPIDDEDQVHTGPD